MRTLIQRALLRHYQKTIAAALALHIRGEARRDGLYAEAISTRLEITWRALAIHPWDREVSLENKSMLFVEQTLNDVEAAITRLFDRLPQVDALDLKVLDGNPAKAIIVGTVQRVSANVQGLSVRMRLANRGLNFKLEGPRFVDLSEA